MMGLSDGRKSFPIGLAVFIQYRSVTATQRPSQPPASHVAVAIALNALAKASSPKTILPAWERVPMEKSLFEARERQTVEMAGLGTINGLRSHPL